MRKKQRGKYFLRECLLPGSNNVLLKRSEAVVYLFNKIKESLVDKLLN